MANKLLNLVREIEDKAGTVSTLMIDHGQDIQAGWRGEVVEAALGQVLAMLNDIEMHSHHEIDKLAKA